MSKNSKTEGRLFSINSATGMSNLAPSGVGKSLEGMSNLAPQASSAPVVAQPIPAAPVEQQGGK